MIPATALRYLSRGRFAAAPLALDWVLEITLLTAILTQDMAASSEL